MAYNFNPRAPCGARPFGHWEGDCVCGKFQSTCPLRGTTTGDGRRNHFTTISIHVPLAGHDIAFVRNRDKDKISIHVPLAGHDFRRAERSRLKLHFNPRAPCGARLPHLRRVVIANISIHVPLAGHDVRGRLRFTDDDGFQSTCPLRGTTRLCFKIRHVLLISIHVPLAGHDHYLHGARQVYEPFQSTCPLRGTTGQRFHAVCVVGISIHVPLAGHDYIGVTLLRWSEAISIHVPLAGHDTGAI